MANVRIDSLKAALERDREQTRSDVAARADGWAVARGISDRTDALLRRVVRAVAESEAVDPADLWRAIEPLALGSYARRDLAPHSDVDVMFLVDRAAPSEVRTRLDQLLYTLWDQGFELGHSVRSLEEALEAAESDPRVLSTLIEHRPVPFEGGHRVRHPRLDAALQQLFSTPSRVRAFIEAKLDEAKARRARYGETVFLLEPNVKESEGGLRELHTLRWVAWARWRTADLSGLLKQGVLSQFEARTIERAYGFLLLVRAYLHAKAGRRQDVLRFDLQEEIAPSLGFWPRPTAKDRRKAATERFMRAYYFHARQLALSCRTAVDRAAAHRRPHTTVLPAPGGFRLWNGQLNAAHRRQFVEDPAALVRVFRVAQEEALPIYDHTKNLIREGANRMDREVRRRTDVVREWFGFLEDPKGDATLLQTMHDLGVLKGLMPEFRRVTSRWQHSLYHVYTVDIHSMMVLRNLKRLRRGDFDSEVPEQGRWMGELPRPNVVYMAGLLHDVGKGWERGDHSIRGEAVARSVGARFEAAGLPGWTERETEDLAWLVRQHLLMSDISQRRDISDLQLVRSFAGECGSVERLRMLYVLTFADMRGTSPKVWSTWKHSLLQQLYLNAHKVLTEGPTGSPQAQLRTRRRALMDEIELEARCRPDLHLDLAAVRSFVDAMPDRYVLGFSPRRMLRHAQMWRDVSRLGGLAVHVAHLRREGTTRLTVMCPDRPGLLALLAGTLAANRLQILSAQIFSVERGESAPGDAVDSETGVSGTYDIVGASLDRREEELALDVLHVVDHHGGPCDDPARWKAVREDLERVLFGGADVDRLVAERNPPSGLEVRARPPVPVEVRFDSDDGEGETIVDVFGPDRLGALYRIAKAMADAGLSIELAKISTQGDRLADAFYVKDAEGNAISDPDDRAKLREALVSALESSMTPRKALSQIV